jgi:hypothetical protein
MSRGRHMRRREFITLVSSAAAWPIATRAQQSAMPVIGYLSGATFEVMRDYVAAFHRALADKGFAEGRNVRIEYRWAEGHNEPATCTGCGFGSPSGSSHRCGGQYASFAGR